MIGPEETAKQFLVRPGYVTARDGQNHFITAPELMRLYNVRPSDCLIDRPDALRGYTNEAIRSLYPLTPRSDGDYPDLSGRKDPQDVK